MGDRRAPQNLGAVKESCNYGFLLFLSGLGTPQWGLRIVYIVTFKSSHLEKRVQVSLGPAGHVFLKKFPPRFFIVAG